MSLLFYYVREINQHKKIHKKPPITALKITKKDTILNKININKMIKEFPSFEEHLQNELKNKDFEKEYLRICLSDYAEDGNYTMFFKELEQLVKARTTVSKLAQDINLNRSNLSNILKGKVQPSFDTTIKILRGLGAEIEIKFA